MLTARNNTQRGCPSQTAPFHLHRCSPRHGRLLFQASKEAPRFPEACVEGDCLERLMPLQDHGAIHRLYCPDTFPYKIR